jgi:citronellyl-CoA synthetase
MFNSTIKNRINFFDLITQLPKAIPDLPKIATALYYNFTVNTASQISVVDIFDKTVKKYANNVCIYYLHKKWTYKEFDIWTNRLANQFLDLNIKKGDVVAVLLENRPEILAIVIALNKIGAIAALINNAQRNKTLLHSLNLANPKLFLVGDELLQHFLEIRNQTDFSENVVFRIKHECIKPEENNIQEFDIDSLSYNQYQPQINYKLFAKDPIMYIYTSGTTGLPKASVISNIRWIKAYSAFGLTTLRLQENDILYVPLPLIHGTAMLVCWTSVLAGGAAIVIKNKFSVTDFWKDIDYYKATGFGYIGEMCRYLLNAPEHKLEKYNTLKKMIGNGLRPEIWQAFKNRFDVEQIAEFYASSEGNIAFFNVFNQDQTMGFSITNYAIVEYDKEHNKIVKDKKGFLKKVKPYQTGLLIGEINDRYPFDGYTEKDKSESSILRNAFKKGDAYFNTGDLVKDMGFLHTQFVDRLGDTFRWKGENVSTTEVESIINLFDNINESVVYGVELPNTNGRAGMVNIILNENIKSFNFESFYHYLKSELPTYAIPVFIRFSKNTDTTSTFKYQKSILKEEAFHISKIEDSVYALIDRQYIKINKKIYQNILHNQYRF